MAATSDLAYLLKVIFLLGGGSEKHRPLKRAAVNSVQADFAYLLRVIKLGGSEKSLI